jgi:hypothetical protein
MSVPLSPNKPHLRILESHEECVWDSSLQAVDSRSSYRIVEA